MNTTTIEPPRPDVVPPPPASTRRAIARSLLWGGAALAGWSAGSWFAWRSVGPFYRPSAVGPFLTSGAAVAAALGILLGALLFRARWFSLAAAVVFVGTAAIAPVAVHTIPPLRQLAEHPLLGLKQTYTARPDNDANLYLVRGNDEIIRLTDTSATEVDSDLSPDGRHIVYASNVAGSFDLYVMTLDENDHPAGTHRLTSLPGDEYPDQWSPDGSVITFESVNGNAENVMSIRSDGTGMTALTDDGQSYGGAWSPDGTLLAYSHPVAEGEYLGIWTMHPDGTHPHLLIDIGGNAYGPSWSPNGSQILFTSNRSGDGDVWIADDRGLNSRDLTLGWVDQDSAIGWAPDGTVIFASDRSRTGGNYIYAMSANGTDVRLVVII